MSVPNRSQAFPEQVGTPPFPAFPSVPPLKGEGNVGNGNRDGQGGATEGEVLAALWNNLKATNRQEARIRYHLAKRGLRLVVSRIGYLACDRLTTMAVHSASSLDALEAWAKARAATASDLVPMPEIIWVGGYGGRGYLVALCGQGVAE